MSEKKYGGYTLAELRRRAPYSAMVRALPDLLDAAECAERYGDVILRAWRELKDGKNGPTYRGFMDAADAVLHEVIDELIASRAEPLDAVD